MFQKIEEIQEHLMSEHKELAKFTQHVIDGLKNMEEERKRINAMNAAHHVKIDLEEEEHFQRDLTLFKRLLLVELLKTAEDMENLGKKGYQKHYKDGVK